MRRYGKQFIEEALKPSDEIGLKQAPVQLGLPYQTRADWRSNRVSGVVWNRSVVQIKRSSSRT